MLRLNDVVTNTEGTPAQCQLRLTFKDEEGQSWSFDTVLTGTHTMEATAGQLVKLAAKISVHQESEATVEIVEREMRTNDILLIVVDALAVMHPNLDRGRIKNVVEGQLRNIGGE